MRRIPVVLLAVALPFLVHAQERARPTINQELWAAFSLSGRPSVLGGVLGESLAQRLRTNMEIGYRSADSFFAGRQTYADLGMGYKVSDKIIVGVEGRYAHRTENADRQRVCAKLEFETEKGRLELGYRFDYQHNFRDFGEVREVIRNKFAMGYNIPKWKLDPKASVEFFTWAGHRGLVYFGTRYKLGTEWSPKKGHTIGFGILHDRERMVFAPTYRFVASVDYSINLRKS